MLFSEKTNAKSAESEDSGKKTSRKCANKAYEKKDNNKKSSKSSEKISSPSLGAKSGHASVPGTSKTPSQKPSRENSVVTESPTDKSNSGNDVTLSDLMECLIGVKNDQKTSNKRLNELASKVDEIYDYDEEYDEDRLLYGDEDEYDKNVQSDENNNPEVDPPAKRRKVVASQPETDQSGANGSVAANDTSNEKHQESSGNFKALVEKYKVKEKLDKPVDSDLADLVNNFFQNGLPESQLSDMLKSATRPDNCQMLIKTRVNQLIWDLLSDFTRGEDNRLQFRQGLMIKAAILITKLVNQLNESKDKEKGDVPFQEMMDLGTDALGLMGHYNRLGNLARREFHRPDLSDEYYHLCSPTVPYTEYLYGDDISKKVSDIDNVNRMGRKVRRGRGSGFRFGRRRFGRFVARRGAHRGTRRIRSGPRTHFRQARDYYDEKELGNEEQTYPRYDHSKNSRRRFGRRGPRY